MNLRCNIKKTSGTKIKKKTWQYQPKFYTKLKIKKNLNKYQKNIKRKYSRRIFKENIQKKYKKQKTVSGDNRSQSCQLYQCKNASNINIQISGQ